MHDDNLLHLKINSFPCEVVTQQQVSGNKPIIPVTFSYYAIVMEGDRLAGLNPKSVTTGAQRSQRSVDNDGVVMTVLL